MLFLYYFILFYCFLHRKTIRNWKKIHFSIWVYSLCNKAHVVKTFTAYVLILHEKTVLLLTNQTRGYHFSPGGGGDQKALSYSTNHPLHWQLIGSQILYSPFVLFMVMPDPLSIPPENHVILPLPPSQKKTKQNKTKQNKTKQNKNK